MRLTRSQLKKIILESISEDENLHLLLQTSQSGAQHLERLLLNKDYSTLAISLVKTRKYAEKMIKDSQEIVELLDKIKNDIKNDKANEEKIQRMLKILGIG